MSTKFGGRALTAIAVVLLLHAGYSMVHYKHLVTRMGASSYSVPFDVYAETALAVLGALAGLILMVDAPMPLRFAPSSNRTYDTVLARPDFAQYDNRWVALRKLRVAAAAAAGAE